MLLDCFTINILNQTQILTCFLAELNDLDLNFDFENGNTNTQKTKRKF
jgi:hypothetical protein